MNFIEQLVAPPALNIWTLFQCSYIECGSEPRVESRSFDVQSSGMLPRVGSRTFDGTWKWWNLVVILCTFWYAFLSHFSHFEIYGLFFMLTPYLFIFPRLDCSAEISPLLKLTNFFGITYSWFSPIWFCLMNKMVEIILSHFWAHIQVFVIFRPNLFDKHTKFRWFWRFPTKGQ